MSSYSTTDFPSDALRYVRRVYTWLLAGIMAMAAGAYASINVGTPVEAVLGKEHVIVPPLVAAMATHPLFMFLVVIGLVMLAAFARKVPGLNAAVFFVLTPVLGLFMGPAIFVTQAAAKTGTTISAHPVRDAMALTLLTFGGLTGYVFASKKDFSAWGGALMTGLLVLIGAGILGLFFGSTAYGLALSSVGVILFAGFILYDTSVILRKSDMDDPIGDALNLLLDVLNLFMNLLHILGSPIKKD